MWIGDEEIRRNWGKKHWQRHKIKAKPKRSVTYRHRHRPSDKRDKVMFPRNRLSALQATTLPAFWEGAGRGIGGVAEQATTRRRPQAPSPNPRLGPRPKTKTRLWRMPAPPQAPHFPPFQLQSPLPNVNDGACACRRRRRRQRRLRLRFCKFYCTRKIIKLICGSITKILTTLAHNFIYKLMAF